MSRVIRKGHTSTPGSRRTEKEMLITRVAEAESTAKSQLTGEASRIANRLSIEDVNQNIVKSYLDSRGITYANWKQSDRLDVINGITQALKRAYPSTNYQHALNNAMEIKIQKYGREGAGFFGEWDSYKNRLLDDQFEIEKNLVKQAFENEKKTIINNYVQTHLRNRVGQIKRDLQDKYTNRMEAGPLINIRNQRNNNNNLLQFVPQQPSQNLLNLFSGAAAAGGGGAEAVVAVNNAAAAGGGGGAAVDPFANLMMPHYNFGGYNIEQNTLARLSNAQKQKLSNILRVTPANAQNNAVNTYLQQTLRGGRKTRKNRKASRRTRRR
jgi:hypothetical protein